MNSDEVKPNDIKSDHWGQALLSCETLGNQMPKNYSFQWKGPTPMTKALEKLLIF